MISDKSLYSAFLDGDISSFEELVIRHRHSLVYFIMQFIKSYHIAEDIAQEVFAYIYVHPEQYSAAYEFKTFLFMLAKRRAIDYYRKESRLQFTNLDEADIRDSGSLDEIVFRREDIAFLKNYINMSEYIYYRTDHHWTSRGAYYAYEKWAEVMGFNPFPMEKFDIVLASDQFYGTIHSKLNYKIKPDNIYLYKLKEDMNYSLTYNLDVQSDSLYDLEKLKAKDKYSVYMGGNNAIVEVKTDNKNARKLLVIKDSFAHSFVPFAVNHYETTYMVDLRYYNGSISDLIEDNGITDILVLYNVIGFVKDNNISKCV